MKEKYDKSTSQILEELKVLKEKGLINIEFPCNFDIREDALHILKKAKAMGFKIILGTNARIFFYKEIASEFAKFVDNFEILLCGDDKSHNQSVQTESYNQTIKGIKNLRELDAKTAIISIIDDYNYNKVLEIFNLVNSLGLKKLGLIYNFNDGKQIIRVIDVKNIKLIDENLHWFQKHDSYFDELNKKFYFKNKPVLDQIRELAELSYNLGKTRKPKITLFANMSCIGGAALYVLNMVKYISDSFRFSIILLKDEINSLYIPDLESAELIKLSQIDKCVECIKNSDMVYVVGAISLARHMDRIDKTILDILKDKKQDRLLVINDPKSGRLPELLKEPLENYFDYLSFTCETFKDRDSEIFNPNLKMREFVLYHPVFEKPILRNYGAKKELVIGRLSRDVDYKFSEDTVEFYKHFCNDFKFIFLGGKNTILKKLNGQKLPENWILYDEGEISKEEFFSMIDIFMYKTSKDYHEYFGQVIVEAQHAGLPVVTEKRDAYIEQIEYGKTGFLCSSNEEFFLRINELKDEKIREKIGKNAQKHIEDNFSVNDFTLSHSFRFHNIISPFSYKYKDTVFNKDIYNCFLKKMRCIESEKNRKCKHTIAYIVPSFANENESYFINEIKAVDNFRRVVITDKIRNYQKIKSLGIPVYLVPTGSNNLFEFEFKKILRYLNVKLIHCQFGFDGPRVLEICKKLNIPLLVSFKGYDAYGHPLKYPNYYKNLFFENIKILVPSEHMASHLNGLDCSRSNIFYHTFGCDLNKFKFIKRDFKDETTFLFTGRLIGLKGLEYALMAFKRLTNDFPNIKFKIIGDGDKKEKLIKLKNDLSLNNHVEIISDIIPHNKIFSELKNADIFLHPSVVDEKGRTEGVPNSVIEAMATGMPVISTYHGGIPELVENGISGFLVKEKSVEELYEKMKYVLNHKDLWERIGLNARKKVLEKYNLEKQTKKLENLYETLIEKEKNMGKNFDLNKENNCEKAMDDFFNRNIEVSSFPQVMYIESVKGCSGSCIMCKARKTELKDISIKLIDEINSYLKNLKVLCIHGLGESLLSNKLDYFIDFCKKNDCLLYLNCNPMFLNEELINRLLKAKIAISFSIHAGKKDTFKKIMGGDFDEVKRKLKYFSELNKGIGNKSNRFKLLFIVVKDNLEEIEDFLSFSKSVGIPNVQFQKLDKHKSILEGVYRENNNYKFEFSEQSNKQVMESFFEKIPKIEEIARDLGVSVKFDTILENMENTGNTRRKGICTSPWLGDIRIRESGNVELCCRSNYLLGNLYENSFEKIWNSDRIKKIRKEFQDGYFPDVCGNCKGHFDLWSEFLSFKNINSDKKFTGSSVFKKPDSKKEYLNNNNLFIVHELPTVCNLNCDYCFSKQSREKFKPEFQKYGVNHFKNFYDNFDPGKTIAWFCSYGEPISYPNFKGIMDYFFNRELPMGFVSNLTDFNFFETLDKKYLKNIAIQWSIHLSEYERLGLTDKVFELAHKLRSGGALIAPLVVLSKSNLKNLDLLYNYQSKYDFKCILRRQRIYLRRGYEQFIDYDLNDKKLINEARKRFLFTEYDVESKKQDVFGGSCFSGRDFFVIKPNWTIYTCFPYRKIIGNFPFDIHLEKNEHICDQQHCECPLALYVGSNRKFGNFNIKDIYFPYGSRENLFYKRLNSL